MRRDPDNHTYGPAPVGDQPNTRRRRIASTISIAAMVLSAVLAVTVAACWVRSYWFCDSVGCRTGCDRDILPNYELHIWSAHGSMEISVGKYPQERTICEPRWRYQSSRGTRLKWGGARDSLVHWLGFRFARFAAQTQPFVSPGSVLVNTPHWFPFLLLSVYPAFRIRHWLIQRRRARLGFCACGYDLRGSVSRCSECGRLIGEGARSSDYQVL
ncbi:MAG: hypothetical protein HY287_13405 [Planctomycetes bacterium]|nr:hypothetical protein [Planctomycetota bacterium]MBI3835320.1 hypothetical protein [Planctomycetota bacterium]